MANNDGTYTVKKSEYEKAIKRDSYFLYLYGKLSEYTMFKSKACPNINHIIKREKWNVIERELNKWLVTKNKYNQKPKWVTANLKGKSYTYCEVRAVQHTEYTCVPTSASMCSLALRNYYSEYYFQIKTRDVRGVNILQLKAAIKKTGFKASYFTRKSIDKAVRLLGKTGCALIAYLPDHYVSIIDVSKDGKKILVSNSYGSYNKGGRCKVPTGWNSLKYFITKFAGISLIVKLNYKLSAKTKKSAYNLYKSFGPKWTRQYS